MIAIRRKGDTLLRTSAWWAQIRTDDRSFLSRVGAALAIRRRGFFASQLHAVCSKLGIHLISFDIIPRRSRWCLSFFFLERFNRNIHSAKKRLRHGAKSHLLFSNVVYCILVQSLLYTMKMLSFVHWTLLVNGEPVYSLSRRRRGRLSPARWQRW